MEKTLEKTPGDNESFFDGNWKSKRFQDRAKNADDDDEDVMKDMREFHQRAQDLLKGLDIEIESRLDQRKIPEFGKKKQKRAQQRDEQPPAVNTAAGRAFRFAPHLTRFGKEVTKGINPTLTRELADKIEEKAKGEKSNIKRGGKEAVKAYKESKQREMDQRLDEEALKILDKNIGTKQQQVPRIVNNKDLMVKAQAQGPSRIVPLAYEDELISRAMSFTPGKMNST